MSKTPEEMAEEYCNTKQLSYVERLVITKGFIDGYKAGVKEAEERILNEFFDNYGADEHASFALRVNAYQLK